MLVQIGAVLELGGAGPRDDDPAAVEHDDIVGDGEDELGVLLDQEDRQALLLEPADRRHHLGDDLRRQALRRLVHQQDARVRHERAADREHLLLAAREIARDLARAARRGAGRSRRRGERTRPARRRRGGRAATVRFSRTVRLLKMRRPCGTSADARAATSSGAAPGRPRSPKTRPRRARGGTSPTATFMQVDLPAPLRPSRPEQPALVEPQRDAVQHMAVAVEGVDVAERERVTSPR